MPRALWRGATQSGPPKVSEDEEFRDLLDAVDGMDERALVRVGTAVATGDVGSLAYEVGVFVQTRAHVQIERLAKAYLK